MWRAVLASCQLPVFTGEFDLPRNCPSPSPLCSCPKVCDELISSALAQGKVACLQWKPCVPLGCWPSDWALKAKMPESSKPSRASSHVFSRKLPNTPRFVGKWFFTSCSSGVKAVRGAPGSAGVSSPWQNPATAARYCRVGAATRFGLGEAAFSSVKQTYL